MTQVSPRAVNCRSLLVSAAVNYRSRLVERQLTASCSISEQQLIVVGGILVIFRCGITIL